MILVVATDGELGLASQAYAEGGLAARRRTELETSARALGVARVKYLGYADSGLGPALLPDPPGRTRFVRADTDEVRVAERAHGGVTVGLAAGPQVTPAEPAEHGRSAGVRPLALERVEDLLHRVRHASSFAASPAVPASAASISDSTGT